MSGFAGLSSDFHAFFRELAAEQSRDWFQANRGRYEAAVRDPVRELVGATNVALAAQDVPLEGDPKRSVSRINRDVRFSADKRPYKTYVAATFTRQPGEMSPGLLYVQLSPDECFAGAGFYAVEPETLARLRAAIVERPNAWTEVETALAAVGTPLETSEALKRMPRGFETHAEAPFGQALKLKSHVCKIRLDVGDLGPELPKRLASFAASARPLLEFGWRALGISRPS